eukprot:6669046-Prymnesium_polylepis.1
MRCERPSLPASWQVGREVGGRGQGSREGEGCKSDTVQWRCGAVQCGAVRRNAVQCGAARRGAVRCGAVRYSAVRCGAVQCGAVWIG